MGLRCHSLRAKAVGRCSSCTEHSMEEGQYLVEMAKSTITTTTTIAALALPRDHRPQRLHTRTTTATVATACQSALFLASIVSPEPVPVPRDDLRLSLCPSCQSSVCRTLHPASSARHECKGAAKPVHGNQTTAANYSTPVPRLLGTTATEPWAIRCAGSREH
jgi:hypothetical protein